MNYTGKPKELTVIGADGNVQKVNVNGMDVSNLKVLTPDGKTTFIEGNSRIQLGRSETLKSGRVVQNVKVYKPKEMYIDSNGEIKKQELKFKHGRCLTS
jgi:hypothetical protein